MTVSEFLIERLLTLGVEHIFGVPGDYILNFYKNIEKSKINLINNTDENQSGFAADAYARIKGIGAVAVTYSVGGLKLTNAVAGAYAEKSPLVVISGAPGIKERSENFLLHHFVRSFDCQREIFGKITCATAVLDNQNTAGAEIDRVLKCLQHYKQPVYIELPRDIADKQITYDVYKSANPINIISNEVNLNESVKEVYDWLEEARNPVILVGVEVARFRLGEQVVKLAEKLNAPIATTLLSKSVINEMHHLFAGVYSGASSEAIVKQLVEDSDCLLMLGVMVTDVCLGFMPSKIDKCNTVNCTVANLTVKNHGYKQIVFSDFINAISARSYSKSNKFISFTKNKPERFAPTSKKITSERFFEKINSILDENMTVISDIGDSLFGSADLLMHDAISFLSPAFYTSMGFAIPAALGAQLANGHRPIVFVGDGAFQMSCTELSTIVSRNLNPIIFVLNNNGYLTEKLLLDGEFNNIRNWNYEKIIDLIGGGIGYSVDTENELDKVIDDALGKKELSVINVNLTGISSALQRLTHGLSKKVR